MQQRIYRHHPERYRSENMATFVNTFNLFLFFVFSLCYMYQAVYAVIVLVKDHRRKITHVQDEPLHKFAVMIAGRNEEAVIGELVRSIKNQDYPEELIDVFVIADNCTDNTAQVAEEAGAEVLVRNDRLVVGKSHALDSRSTASASYTVIARVAPITMRISSSTPITCSTPVSSRR